MFVSSRLRSSSPTAFSSWLHLAFFCVCFSLLIFASVFPRVFFFRRVVSLSLSRTLADPLHLGAALCASQRCVFRVALASKIPSEQLNRYWECDLSSSQSSLYESESRYAICHCVSKIDLLFCNIHSHFAVLGAYYKMDRPRKASTLASDKDSTPSMDLARVYSYNALCVSGRVACLCVCMCVFVRFAEGHKTHSFQQDRRKTN